MILGSEAEAIVRHAVEVEGEETGDRRGDEIASLESRAVRRALNSARGAWDSRSLSIDCRRRAKAVMCRVM